MATQKHLKSRVRARMAKTGERYAAARANVVGQAAFPDPAPPESVGGVRHVGGIHPETTVLRILAAHAGIASADRDPLDEALLLAIGGGPGAGVFAFHYEKEQFSSLYLSGRHRWEDSADFITAAAARLGLEATVSETSSPAKAERDLRTALEQGPVAAWVDHIELGYRGSPPEMSGGAYHVLVVYQIDRHEAIVGDLAVQPIRIPLDVLARARARVAKQRNRLIQLSPARRGTIDPMDAARAGLAAAANALATEPRRNFSLAAFEDLARRMTATKGANSWARIFPRGRLLWAGLTSLNRYVDAYFTGGGLMRPMVGRGVAMVAEATNDDGLREVASRYEALGVAWSELATAALPSQVPAMAEARHIQAELDRRFAADGAAATPRLRESWARLAELEVAAGDFPLTESETADLLDDLASRLRRIHADEVEALEQLRAATASRARTLGDGSPDSSHLAISDPVRDFS